MLKFLHNCSKEVNLYLKFNPSSSLNIFPITILRFVLQQQDGYQADGHRDRHSQVMMIRTWIRLDFVMIL